MGAGVGGLGRGRVIWSPGGGPPVDGLGSKHLTWLSLLVCTTSDLLYDMPQICSLGSVDVLRHCQLFRTLVIYSIKNAWFHSMPS